MIAQETTTFLLWTRTQLLHEWWHWPTLVLIVISVVAFVTWLYRRDALELPRWTRFTLYGLRWVSLIALLLFFFGLERRSEQRSTQNSRLAILVDTSQSMGMSDDTQPSPGNRIDRVRELLQPDKWLTTLRDNHDVVVYATGSSESPEQVAFFAQQTANSKLPAAPRVADVSNDRSRRSVLENRLSLLLACGGVILFVTFIWQWIRGQEVIASRWLASSVVCLLLAGILAANRDLFAAPFPDVLPSADVAPDRLVAPVTNTDLDRVLQPTHDSTRLGDSIFAILQQNRNQPLAGLIVLTDGGQNQGKDPLTVTQFARQQTVPLYPVGLGNSSLPRNVAMVDLQMPPRIYPQDQFHATVYIQGSQMVGRPVEVQLYARPATGPSLPNQDTSPGSSATGEQLVDTQQVTLGDDNQLVTTQFNLEPPGAGTWSYRAVIVPASQETNLTDNERTARVEIVDRRTRVLLIAGGPTREYQFVRNQLFRDSSMQSDVWLQTGTSGTAQDTQQILQSFPSTAEELFAYDSIVAFDPDWSQLNAEQVVLLERWVSEEAGGMMLIAGPVYSPRLSEVDTRNSPLEKIRVLYPVDFYRRGNSGVALGRTSGEQAWAPQFTAEGLAARFLWLGDSQEESTARWSTFPGFYSYLAVRGTKPGATVYATFSDPDTETRGELPPYIAGQYYGSGRTLYLASGELWRLRELDVSYQEQLYTKLVRFVAEGRLLRDSQHGTLLLDKQRCTGGERVTVRVQLKDQQLRPWKAEHAEATLTLPDGSRQPFNIPALPDSPGIFQTTMVAASPGTYVLSLQVPDGKEYDVLSRELEVRLADRELEQPLRSDNLLHTLATETGGVYFVGVPAVMGQGSVPPLAESIRPRPQVTVLEGAPDTNFDQRWMKWLMIFLCGSLSAEWLVRRLHRLA
ncbi:MAG: hypothetical protein O2931_02310 [Planctomycetota bacterium]|nr:hypothetical protein [Planctomycetota bacterium]MDA1177608.1 hypothetical protein [Planctomycetota bacterium]